MLKNLENLIKIDKAEKIKRFWEYIDFAIENNNILYRMDEGLLYLPISSIYDDFANYYIDTYNFEPPTKADIQNILNDSVGFTTIKKSMRFGKDINTSAYVFDIQLVIKKYNDE